MTNFILCWVVAGIYELASQYASENGNIPTCVMTRIIWLFFIILSIFV